MPLWVGSACLLCCVLAGCHENVYKPSKLPLEFSATKSPNLRKVDLSRLGRSSAQIDVIYPGDVIHVNVVTGIEDRNDGAPLGWDLRVLDNGEVNVPLVGPVRVAGLILLDAEQAIRQESITRKVYRDPHVAVTLTHRKSIRVTVVGAVKNPGSYELPAANNDLLHALVAAGGLTEKASSIVEIRSLSEANALPVSYPGQRQTVAQSGAVQIDLITASEGITPDYQIADGSVLMVREREPRTIQVIGLVRKADRFEVPPDKEVRLLDAIALANGRTMEIVDKVHVIRQLEGMKQPIVIQASVKAAKRGGPDNLLLAAGDVVSLEETPLTFTVGTIREFIRFGFSAAVPGL